MILVPENMTFSHWCVLDCSDLTLVVCMYAPTAHTLVIVYMDDRVFRGQSYESRVLIHPLGNRLFNVREKCCKVFLFLSFIVEFS